VAERGQDESFREFVARIGAAELTRVGFAAAKAVI